MISPGTAPVYIILAILTLGIGLISARQSAKLSDQVMKGTLKAYFFYYSVLTFSLTVLFELFVVQLFLGGIQIQYALRAVHMVIAAIFLITTDSLLSYNQTTLADSNPYIRYINIATSVTYILSLATTVPLIGTGNEFESLVFIVPAGIAMAVTQYTIYRSVANKVIQPSLADVLRNQGNFATACFATLLCGVAILSYSDSNIIQLGFISTASAALVALAIITANMFGISQTFSKESWQNKLKRG